MAMAYWLVIPLALLLVRVIHRRYVHPLRRVPGPFLASVTDLYRVFVFVRGCQHHVYQQLFAKYGPLVRLGPHTVILNDAAHFAEYFTYSKSHWAEVFRARLDVFDHATVADIGEHAKYKKQIMGAYNMSHILKSEGVVDGHIMGFMGMVSYL